MSPTHHYPTRRSSLIWRWRGLGTVRSWQEQWSGTVAPSSEATDLGTSPKASFGFHPRNDFSSLRMKHQMKSICKTFSEIGLFFRDESNDSN